MASTLTRLLVHMVWSTKNRIDLITPDIEPELFRYIGGISRNAESPLLAAGGMPDHVHVLVALSKNIALADLVMDIKKDSSKWIKTKGVRPFAWQDGYGAITIGESQVPTIKRYFANQKVEHRTVSFKEEFEAFLRKYKIDYDPKHVWS